MGGNIEEEARETDGREGEDGTREEAEEQGKKSRPAC